MSTIKRAAMAAAFGIFSVPALADPGSLQLIIGGEAYDGPPRFEVSFDGRVLGEAAVDAAIDTATTGRFAETPDKAPYVQTFTFEVPEDVFRPGAEVRVKMLNEAYGGDGSNRDRNLYLAAVAVNGRAVTVSGFTTEATGGAAENEVLGEFLVLRDGNVEGVSRAPAGGWPLPGASAVVEAAVAPATPAPATPPASATPEPGPASVIALRAPEAPAEAQPAATVQTETVQTATLEPQGSVQVPACDRDELYNVVGFNESSNDLTPRLTARLDQIIADIGDEKCTVLVTGYSSRQGDHATNALFAIERAQNVLAYLKNKGLAYTKASAAGAGATDQFGPTSNANRRVVVSVMP